MTHLHLLQDAETNWQFDIFGFAEQAQGNALSLLSFHFMKKFAKIDTMGFDVPKLATFVRVIEKGYDPKNPYHNRLALHLTPCWAIHHFNFPASPFVCQCCLLNHCKRAATTSCGPRLNVNFHFCCLHTETVCVPRVVSACLSVCLLSTVLNVHSSCNVFVSHVCLAC